MSINDPILEALSFSLQNDLNVSVSPSTSSSCAAGSKLETSAVEDGERPVQFDNSFTRSSQVLEEEELTLCPFPVCLYSIKENICSDKKRQGELLAHLLVEHKLVIDNVDEVANLNLYLNYWRSRFNSAPITEFCVGFIMDEPPKPPPEPKKKKKKGTEEEVRDDNCKGESTETVKSEERKTTTGDDRMYYMLSPALPEDKQLRKELWKRRLNIVLEVNRQEREDNGFCRRCLFCRDIISGNRSEYFFHMRDSHSFHIGQPDNLVFVKELLQYIEDKLNRLECLFCENVFKDKAVLKEHMRKKQHRKINPKNHDYDKFYVVNYLEPGKTWETLELEDAEDERKEDEWIEPIDEKEKTIVCLFCKDTDSEFQKTLSHMESNHHFNFTTLTSSLDFYQKVKLVNYIRRTVYQNSCFRCEQRFDSRELLLEHISEHTGNDCEDVLQRMKQWNGAEYFFPTYEDDDFLTCLDTEDNDDVNHRSRHESMSSIESNVIPEDLPQLDIRNRDFDLAGFAIRYHNYNRS